MVRRASSCLPEIESAGLRLAHALACHYARCLSRGGTARELAARTRRAALALAGSCTRQGHCTGERLLSFDVRPWCDVPDAASQRQNRLAFASHALARATALAVSREEAQHTSLLRARAVPRLLSSVYAVQTGTVQESGLSHSACCRGATHQLRPPIISRLSHGTRERATALAVSWEEAQHASLLRACAVPRCLLSVHAIEKGAAPARGLSRLARCRGGTCQRYPPRTKRHSRGTRGRATALVVSQEEA